MTSTAEPAGSHVYLYGIARTGGAEPPPIGDGVVANFPVQLLPVGGLSAIVSIFPAGTVLHEPGHDDSEWAKSSRRGPPSGSRGPCRPLPSGSFEIWDGVAEFG